MLDEVKHFWTFRTARIDEEELDDEDECNKTLGDRRHSIKSSVCRISRNCKGVSRRLSSRNNLFDFVVDLPIVRLCSVA